MAEAQPEASNRALAWAAVATTLFLWASAFVAIRAGLRGYAPGHLAVLRFITASAALGIFALIRRPKLPRAKDLPILAVHGFFGFTAYHLLLNYGERTVSAASACFLIGAIPIFTTLLAGLLLKERLGGRLILGIVVSMAGVTLIALGEGGSLGVNFGAVLILLAAFSESLFIVLQKPFLSRYTPTEYVTWTVFAGTILMAPWSPGLWEAVREAPAQATFSAVYMGVGPAAVAYATWAYALKRAPASKITATQFSMPAVTMLLGWLFLGEWPRPLAVIGGLIALAGVALGVILPSSTKILKKS